ncbi:MAG TPA: hypothetical protein VFI51_10260 [Bradyrhizobium sp.]|nr:hypothetical protein [Bradyrhizobium sp.]
MLSSDLSERDMNSKVDAVGIASTLLLVAALAFRLTQGADLSDESYYALFIDDWLKGSIATSAFRTIHQTAALIAYPAAVLYAKGVGSSDGLFLFLRVLFLIGAVASCFFWTIFLKRLGHRLLAWAGGLLVLSFVPFGLPAPSYNTLGQQALSIALASFGCACLFDQQAHKQFWWLVVSGCAWAAATIAYPPMLVPLTFLCLSGLLFRDGMFPRPLLYLITAAAAVASSWCLVALSMTPSRLRDCFIFSSTGFDMDGVRRRWAFVHDLFAANPYFSILCAAALVIGIARLKFPLASRLGTIVMIASLFVVPTALFVRSHDAITLLALSGIGLVSGFKTSATRAERTIGTIYATSMVAGFVTCATAHASVYNFCIGALPAAILAIPNRPCARSLSIAAGSSVSIAIAAVLSTSLFFYYGELPGQPESPRERISKGVFSGLSLTPNDAALVHLMQSRITPILEVDQTVALLGRLPGLALATPTRLNMPSPYPILPISGEERLKKTEAFYQDQDRQPSIVLIYLDLYFAVINPIPHFEDRYSFVTESKTPLGTLTAFRKR